MEKLYFGNTIVLCWDYVNESLSNFANECLKDGDFLSSIYPHRDFNSLVKNMRNKNGYLLVGISVGVKK